MNLLQRNALLVVIFILGLMFIYNVQLLWHSDDLNDRERVLLGQLNSLEKSIIQNDEKIKELRNDIQSSFRHKFDRVDHKSILKPPIPVLVFVCSRVDAVKYHLERLISVRKTPEAFPIIVSQDCDNEDVADTVRQFGSSVTYIKQKSNITVPKNHRRYAMYYKIANHYKLGLQYVFNQLNYSSVIVTEDDLDVSEDFFDYFAATRSLLDTDPTLYCVSAWNDNGKTEFIDLQANDLLYRSDFFPGLGWMMSRKLWDEIGGRWPTGFWDDWIREPEQRRDRACIRPEISRTAMTLYGKVGASKGLFFNRHLKKIILNTKPVEFLSKNLNYLIKSQYDKAFTEMIYALPSVSIEAFIKLSIIRQKIDAKSSIKSAYRVEYKSMLEYTQIAVALRIMPDTKAGVPRTAYLGIVSCFLNGIRVYVAPAQTPKWSGYQRDWEAPEYLIKDLL